MVAVFFCSSITFVFFSFFSERGKREENKAILPHVFFLVPHFFSPVLRGKNSYIYSLSWRYFLSSQILKYDAEYQKPKAKDLRYPVQKERRAKKKETTL